MDILHRMILQEAPAHLAFTGPTMEQFRMIFIPCNMSGAAIILYDLADELMQPNDRSDDGPVRHEYTLDGCKLVYC